MVKIVWKPVVINAATVAIMSLGDAQAALTEHTARTARGDAERTVSPAVTERAERVTAAEMMNTVPTVNRLVLTIVGTVVIKNLRFVTAAEMIRMGGFAIRLVLGIVAMVVIKTAGRASDVRIGGCRRPAVNILVNTPLASTHFHY